MKPYKLLAARAFAAAACLPFFFPACLLFLVRPLPALCAALVSAWLIAPLPLSLYRLFQESRMRKQLLTFLQSTLHALNMGNTLHYSLYRSAASAADTGSGKTARRARALCRALENNAASPEVSRLLSNLFRCPEGPPFFSLLKDPERLGSRLPDLFRRYETMLRESERDRESLAADRAKTLSECLTLLAMPLILLLFLRFSAPSFVRDTLSAPRGWLILGTAYLLFLAALLLAGKIFLASHLLSKNKTLSPASALHFLRRMPLPAFTLPFLRRPVRKAMLYLYRHDTEAETLAWKKLSFDRLRALLSMLLLMLVLTAAGYKAWPLIFPALLLFAAPDLSLILSAGLEREKLQETLPLFFTFVSLSLSCGNSLTVTLGLAEETFKGAALLADELSYMNTQLLNREAPAAVLQAFSERLDFAPASMYLNLLSKISSGASSQDLALLDLQTLHFNHVLREKQRRRLAVKANHYLFPMMLDLLSVMLISLTPALPGLTF